MVRGWGGGALGADIAVGAGVADHTIRPFIQAGAVLAEAQALGQLAWHGVTAAQGAAVALHQL